MCCYLVDNVSQVRATTGGVLLGCLLLAAPVLGATNEIIVPREATNSFGTEQGELFNSFRYQQVYNPSEFDAVKSPVIAITELHFRWREGNTNGGGAGYLNLNLGIVPTPKNRQYEENFDAVRVVSATNTVFPAVLPRTLLGFDIQFALLQPYVYDIRTGWLVLEGDSDFGTPVDAFGVESSRGDHYKYRGFGGVFWQWGEVIVTKFIYVPLAYIESIRLERNNVLIEIFTPPGEEVSVVSAETINGRYEHDQDVVLLRTSHTNVQAEVTPSLKHQFFRVRTAD